MSINKIHGIGPNIGSVRKHLGLSLQTISEATEIGEATISRFINSQYDPLEDWVDKFCESFHVDKEWLLHGEGEPIFTAEVGVIERKDVSGAGARLVQMRKELGLRQREVYDAIGIANPTYSRIENGKTRLTEENAKKIEERFGIGADWLLYGDAEKKEYPVSKSMIEYLWKNKELRKKIWEEMKFANIDG